MRKESLLIKRALIEKGFDNRVSQRTISFMDLTREIKLFVFIHNWVGHPFFKELQEIGKANNFIVSTK
jgi:hypothetical protein